MEGLSEVSWSSFNATMADDESELMAQLLGPYPFSSEQDQELSLGIQSLFWSDHVTDTYYSSQDANSGYWPQENNSSTFSTSSFFAPSSDYQEYCMSESNAVPAIINNDHEEMVFNMVEGAMTVPSNSFGYLNEETSSEDVGDSAVKESSSDQVIALDQKPQHKRKFSMDEVNKPTENGHEFDIATDISTKKAKVSSQVRLASFLFMIKPCFFPMKEFCFSNSIECNLDADPEECQNCETKEESEEQCKRRRGREQCCCTECCSELEFLQFRGRFKCISGAEWEQHKLQPERACSSESEWKSKS